MWCVPEIDREFVRRMEDVLGDRPFKLLVSARHRPR
jgi:hypothetical protein